MHWGGSSKNKINLQLNKNTISIIKSWKMSTSPIIIIFFFWITSDNQLPFGSTAMTTHSYIGLVYSIRLVHTAVQNVHQENESRATLQDLRDFFCCSDANAMTKWCQNWNMIITGKILVSVPLLTLNSSRAFTHVHQQRQQVSTTVSRMHTKQNSCETVKISRAS